MWRKYDTWLTISRGTDYALKEGTAIIRGLMMFFEDEFLFEGMERIGCAMRVQIQTDEETIKKISEKLNREFEPTRGFVRENCG